MHEENKIKAPPLPPPIGGIPLPPMPPPIPGLNI